MRKMESIRTATHDRLTLQTQQDVSSFKFVPQTDTDLTVELRAVLIHYEYVRFHEINLNLQTRST